MFLSLSTCNGASGAASSLKAKRMTERSEVAKLTKSEALVELELIRANVERVLMDIRNDSALSQRFRTEKMALYKRRIEALTVAIEALEDLR